MVLDGNSIINRAYYGVRPLTTRDGFFTHAIFGFLTMLGRLLDEEKPEALCVAFDRREPTFRHLEYDGYKATRHAMPEELAMQMPVLKDVLDAMNIPRYELAGFEADDLIGTISRKCESAGWDCVVATGDKDSLQLVTEHTTVKLISTRMGQTTTKDMTPESFREVYGFAPIHIVDLKALMGDASDNIPGVPGVGEKPVTAITEGKQFTGTVTWSPEVSTFAASTVYTATITLTPKVGYKLDGVAANFFTVAGATSVSNGANSGVVTAVFPATKEAAT